MTDSHRVRRVPINRWLLQVASPCLLMWGCEGPVNIPVQAAAAEADQTESFSFLLPSRDLERFRPGALMADLFRDTKWRGRFVMAEETPDGRGYAIAYQLFSANPDGNGAAVVYAIFVEEKFSKFVNWLPVEHRTFETPDGPASRPTRVESVDTTALQRLMKSDPVDITKLQREVENRPVSQSEVDPGLTIAWLALLAGSKPLQAPIPEKSRRENAALRDQFHPARLRLGMTPAEVARTFKTAPLESTQAKGRVFEVYGSLESFEILPSEHFANVLTVFTDERLVAIHSAAPQTKHDRPGHWRQELSERFSDLPVP